MDPIYRFYSKEGPNRVTVCGTYKEGALCIAVARCSKKDNFQRKTGRKIAESRLTGGKYFYCRKITDFTLKDFLYLAQSIEREVRVHPERIK